jgi:hypothetical protein
MRRTYTNGFRVTISGKGRVTKDGKQSRWSSVDRRSELPPRQLFQWVRCGGISDAAIRQLILSVGSSDVENATRFVRIVAS